MSTIRVERRDRFTTTDRSVVNDDRLSFRARGILIWLLDKPDGWRVDSDSIAKAGKEGRDAVRAALRELETFGYLIRTRQQVEHGHWVTESVVREMPVDKSPPTTDFQSSETRTSVPQALLRTLRPNTDTPLPPKGGRRHRRTNEAADESGRRDYDSTPLTPEQIAAKWNPALEI